jgi:hypothetical protein
MTESSIRYISFPRTAPPPAFVVKIVEVFRSHEDAISTQKLKKGLTSDVVLALLRDDLVRLGFQVESGKVSDKKIVRPVFFGENGEAAKVYSVDAFHPVDRCGLEIEAGRAIGGNAVYRDLIQAMVMVEVDHLCLAVPNSYRYGKNTATQDFKHTMNLANALFGHTRIAMPYGLTVIGY